MSDQAGNLSLAASVLWGKTDQDNPDNWLPLSVHLSDAAEVARLLWDNWIPLGTKRIIVQGISPTVTLDIVRSLFIFLAAAHDIGKATPAFQLKAEWSSPDLLTRIEGQGLTLPRGRLGDLNAITHSLASQIIAERNDCSRSLAVVLGGHHGKPPSHAGLNRADAYPRDTGFNDELWCKIQDELLGYALQLSGLNQDNSSLRQALPQQALNKPAQVILTGLVIMADWIASDSERFPTISTLAVQLSAQSSSKQRAEEAWHSLELPPYWVAANDWTQADFYQQRFGIATPRPVQIDIVQVLSKTKEPGIVVIEAPMGEGKTEAAFAAAELLAAKTGRGGAFLALPTQATSDGLFKRATHWIQKLDSGHNEHTGHTLFLAHGKARFNESSLPN